MVKHLSIYKIMKYFTTTIQAIDPKDGELKTWGGPRIQAISWGMAEQYLQENGLGYCRIHGELTDTVDLKTGERINMDQVKYN